MHSAGVCTQLQRLKVHLPISCRISRLHPSSLHPPSQKIQMLWGGWVCSKNSPYLVALLIWWHSLSPSHTTSPKAAPNPSYLLHPPSEGCW